MKFTGSSQDLETIVSAIGRTITSSSDKGNMYQIKTDENETSNLHKTGTLQVQASPTIKAKFEEDYNQYNDSATAQPVEQMQHATPETIAARNLGAHLTIGQIR